MWHCGIWCMRLSDDVYIYNLIIHLELWIKHPLQTAGILARHHWSWPLPSMKFCRTFLCFPTWALLLLHWEPWRKQQLGILLEQKPKASLVKSLNLSAGPPCLSWCLMIFLISVSASALLLTCQQKQQKKMPHDSHEKQGSLMNCPTSRVLLKDHHTTCWSQVPWHQSHQSIKVPEFRGSLELEFSIRTHGVTWFNTLSIQND